MCILPAPPLLIQAIRNRIREPHKLGRRLQDVEHALVRRVARRLHNTVCDARDPEDHVADWVAVEEEHFLDLALDFLGVGV